MTTTISCPTLYSPVTAADQHPSSITLSPANPTNPIRKTYTQHTLPGHLAQALKHLLLAQHTRTGLCRHAGAAADDSSALHAWALRHGLCNCSLQHDLTAGRRQHYTNHNNTRG